MADNTGMILPPIRPQKRIVVLPIDLPTVMVEGRDSSEKLAFGQKTVTGSDFEQSRATFTNNYAAGLTDYIFIRLKGRGLQSGMDLKFQFLINPESISINNQTIDAEALTRGGPQVGVWGETTDISISGNTAGQYFAGSLVDGYGEYSMSYRNFQQLMAIYENNGYWFEGESAGSRVNAASHTLKQIQMQSDIELGFGNFLWSGCFTELTCEDTADTPYLNKFTLGFMVWKERYAPTSPWRNSIRNDVYSGHSYEVRQVLAQRAKDRLAQAEKAAVDAALARLPYGATPDPADQAEAPVPPNFRESLVNGYPMFSTSNGGGLSCMSFRGK